MDKAVRRVGVAAAGLAALLVLSACGTDSPEGAEAPAEDSFTAGVTIHQADQYFQTVVNGVESAVGELGGSTIAVNTQTDASEEAAGFQNLVSRQVDGIITSPLSPTGSLASIKAASDAGIPIVCYNTCLEDESEEYAEAFIESDQRDLGRQTGEFAVADLEEQGVTEVTLGMLNCNRYEACKDRQEGFLDALNESELKVNIVADQEALAPDEASNKATDILTANPDINVFWSSSQGSSEGMLAAIKAANKVDDISSYATDVSPALVQAIKDGELRALTGQDSVKTGELAVEYIQMAINGEEIEDFLTSLPGVLYDVNHPEKLDEYLSTN